MLRYCLLSLLGLVLGPAYGQLSNTGLFFNSHQSNIDQRTSLLLNDGKPYKLKSQDVFSIEFDVYLRDELVKFGYFFRIISDKEENFDFIINNDLHKYLIVNNTDYLLSNESIVGKWNHIIICFDKKKNEVRFSFNDRQATCPYDLSGTTKLWAYIGQCDREGFANHDVAPIIVKNILVTGNDKKIHFWELDNHAESKVYDELRKAKALAVNPYWLKDNGAHWKKESSFETKAFAQIAFDSVGSKVFILNEDHLLVYHLQTKATEKIPVAGKSPLNKNVNQLFFDPISRQLMSLRSDYKLISVFNFETREWEGFFHRVEEPSHAHQNSYISPNDSMMYLFGGYGFYQYKSDLFRVDIKKRVWSHFDLSHTITPRYLAAMGGNAAGDKIYILGGRGAEMGRQELSPQNFKDLYLVDLKTVKVKHLYDFPEKNQDKDYVYSGNLVVDEKDSCLYVLSYPNNRYASHILLKKLSLCAPQVEVLSDTIAFFFQDISSSCNLYYSSQTKQLVAIVSYAGKEANVVIDVYTLNYPPLCREKVLQHVEPGTGYIVWLIIATVGGCASIVVILLLLKKKMKRTAKKNDSGSYHDTNVRQEPQVNESVPALQSRQLKQSILFLGGFQVFDKEGNDITREFTPTLKYMLVIIILYTFNEHKGISSGKLQELLWFDKTDEAARNNRNVNIRKLRLLLQSIGDIDITNKNGYWVISLSGQVFLDYQKVLMTINTIQRAESLESGEMMAFLDILSRGPMLPNIQYEWIDDFKNDFFNKVIDSLIRLVNSLDILLPDDQHIRLRIADIMLKIDSISEEAISIKCKALFKMGKKGLGKTVFDNFAKEYEALLGEPYSGSLRSFLGSL